MSCPSFIPSLQSGVFCRVLGAGEAASARCFVVLLRRKCHCPAVNRPSCALQGLRERNWTSKYYNPAAEKWQLQFFEDRCAWGGGQGDGWHSSWIPAVVAAISAQPWPDFFGSALDSRPFSQMLMLFARPAPTPPPLNSPPHLACPPCCSGRFLRPSFEGYRVLLTRADGSQAWVNLDREGAPTFLRDYSGGGGKGAIHAPKRESQQLDHPVLVGLGGGRGGAGGGGESVVTVFWDGGACGCCAGPTMMSPLPVLHLATRCLSSCPLPFCSSHAINSNHAINTFAFLPLPLCRSTAATRGVWAAVPSSFLFATKVEQLLPVCLCLCAAVRQQPGV